MSLQALPKISVSRSNAKNYFSKQAQNAFQSFRPLSHFLHVFGQLLYILACLGKTARKLRTQRRRKNKSERKISFCHHAPISLAVICILIYNNFGVIEMWFLLLVCFFGLLSAWAPPQYALLILGIPFLLPLYILMAPNKWYENLFYLISVPIVFLMILIL